MIGTFFIQKLEPKQLNIQQLPKLEQHIFECLQTYRDDHSIYPIYKMSDETSTYELLSTSANKLQIR